MYFFVAPPPPPPLPIAADDTNEPRGKMNVKRINWEKIDAERVGNTIWEQVCFLPVKKQKSSSFKFLQQFYSIFHTLHLQCL